MTATSRVPYSYAVLRYVHDIATGEFLNVGVVVVGPNDGYVGAKFKTTYGRVKRAFPTIDPDAFRSRMRRLQTVFEDIAGREFGASISPPSSGFKGPSEERGATSSIERLVHSVIRQDDSSFQWSAPGSGLTKNLPATLESLYQRFVTKYDSDGAPLQRKDDDVWKHFRTELERRNVTWHLEEKVIAVADDSVKFDHAWKNGAWHCYEPISFDLSSDASIKEKAHRWLGQVQSIKDAAEAFRVYFLVGKPSGSELNDAYEKALSILRKAPMSKVIEEDQAARFSEDVAQAIATHSPPPL